MKTSERQKVGRREAYTDRSNHIRRRAYKTPYQLFGAKSTAHAQLNQFVCAIAPDALTFA